MQVKYIPEVCKGEGATFEGSLEIKVPSFDQKYQYIEDAGFELGEDGAVAGGMKNMKAIRAMVRFSKDHYVNVDLKRKSDGKEFKSFDDMQYDSDCDSILIEVAGKLMHGFKLGNG